MRNRNNNADANRVKSRDLLLRPPNFVAKSKYARREATPIACEASALTPEPTALFLCLIVSNPA